MTRRLRLIADDYGLAPGVSTAILALIERGRLSGASCMTGFAEWPREAARLKPFIGRTAIGLHLTLTDQPAATGMSSLAPDGRLPALAGLVSPLRRGRIDHLSIHAELDAQHRRFVEALGREPDFIDGHQHVHFLPPARQWLRVRFQQGRPMPALRGSPALALPGAAALKIAAVAALAAGFDGAMRRAGFRVLSPLAGIYDWRRPEGFASLVETAVATLPDDGLFMCHPGHVDAILRGRDIMRDAREVEFAYLASPALSDVLARAGAEITNGLL